MNKRAEYPPCPRKDCRACYDGLCMVLNDNDFGERECPFYKEKIIINMEGKKNDA